MLTDIPTDISLVEGELEPGVEVAFTAYERYELDGEMVKRHTRIEYLEDGAIQISQTIEDQGVVDSLTLNGAVATRMFQGIVEETDHPTEIKPEHLPE